MTKLDPDLRDAVLGRIAGGASLTDCVKWIGKVHGIKISHQALSLLAQKHRSARADAAKVVAREHIARTLPSDLALFDVRLARLTETVEELETRVREEKTYAAVESYLKALQEWRKWDEAKKKAVGLDQPDERFGGLADVLLAVRRQGMDS